VLPTSRAAAAPPPAAVAAVVVPPIAAIPAPPDPAPTVAAAVVAAAVASNTYVIEKYQLLTLPSRIARNSSELGNQMRHDHQQHKPYKSVHGCNNYL